MTTLAQVRSAVSTLIDVGALNLSLAQWVEVVNLACVEVFRQIVDVEPSLFQSWGSATAVAGVEVVDLSVALGVAPYRVLEVARMEGADYHRVRLLPIEWAERADILAGRRGHTVESVTGPVYFTLAGLASLYLAPLPVASVPLRIEYVALPTALTTADTAVSILGGRAVQHHDAVIAYAAVLVSGRSGAPNAAVARQWEQAQLSIVSRAGKRQTAEPRFVRRVRRR